MKLAAMWAALPLAVAAVSAAHAQQCAHRGGYSPAYEQTCEEAYYQNSIWPRQYISPARRGICQSFEAMVNNGWRRQNLLGSYYFEAESAKLNEAGRLRAEWILTQAPPNHRIIYVQRTPNMERTAQRIQAVQDYAAQLADASGPAHVEETHIRDDGYPAGTIDAVFTGFRENQLPPRLPADGALQSSN